MSLHGFSLEKKLDTGTKAYGKYRATVLNNTDPKQMGRIKVECPKVLGDYESNWCLPCLPPGYLSIPPVGSLVWVEFEEGNPNLPIWSGVWYAEGSFPTIGQTEIHLGEGGNRVAREGGYSTKVFAK